MTEQPVVTRVLIDSGVPAAVGRALAAAGHDVDAISSWPSDPGDTVIMRTAHEQRRIIVMLDKDFGELAVATSLPHFGVVRLVSMPISLQIAGCLEALSRYRGVLAAGGTVTLEPGRVRVRPADPL